MKFFSYTLSLLLLFGTLTAEELPPAPDPSDLSTAWWEYFDIPYDQLKERVAPFLEELNKVPADLSPENQTQGEELVQDITKNLKSYLELISEPGPKREAPPPIEDSYTIRELVELNDGLQQMAIEILTLQQETQLLSRDLDSQQRELDKFVEVYRGSGDRSELRELTGLQVINSRILLAIKSEKSERLKSVLQFSRDKLAQAEDERKAAINRLVSSREELSRLTAQREERRLAWEKAKENLRQADQKATSSTEDGKAGLSSAHEQVAVMRQLQIRMRERQAFVHYVGAEVQLSLSQLLLSPGEINHSDLHESIRDWDKQLTQVGQDLTAWKSQIDNLITRTTQLASLGEFPDITDPEEYRKLLETVIKNGQENLSLIENIQNDLEDAQFLLSVTDRRNTEFLGKGAFWTREFYEYLLLFVNGLWDGMSRTLFYMGNRPITLLRIFRFFLILAVAYWLSRYVLNWLTEIIRKRRGIRKAVMYRINRLIQYLILFIGLVVALTALGFDFSNLVLIASALGVGLGFGLQSIFNNFISGIIILFQSHLKVGDYVELGPELRGEIREINVRSTIIRTNDGIEVIIPNSEMISNRLVNWTMREPYRRIQVPFGVAYGTDKELVKKVVLEAADRVPITLKKIGIPEPMVYLSKFGDSALEFELVVWVDERATRRTKLTQSAYLWEIESVFREHGITIPFPQRDLHMKSGALEVEQKEPKE